MIIRPETPTDYEAISEVTELAFRTLAISEHTEQFIIRALRDARVLTLSLVAESEGQVVGHVAFSPVTISDRSPNWHGLGPVSVLPRLHKQGIGTALIQEGLARLKALGSRGCVLVGDPNYYRRFGFRNLPQLVHEGIPPEVFMAKPFYEGVPCGTVEFHPGFWAKS